jgi:hypothetical protein
MSRLSEELRQRTKRYASAVIRLYVTLPRERKEVDVPGNQLLRSGTSVAAHPDMTISNTPDPGHILVRSNWTTN